MTNYAAVNVSAVSVIMIIFACVLSKFVWCKKRFTLIIIRGGKIRPNISNPPNLPIILWVGFSMI